MSKAAEAFNIHLYRAAGGHRTIADLIDSLIKMTGVVKWITKWTHCLPNQKSIWHSPFDIELLHWILLRVQKASIPLADDINVMFAPPPKKKKNKVNGTVAIEHEKMAIKENNINDNSIEMYRLFCVIMGT